jgi:hypothetical protein
MKYRGKSISWGKKVRKGQSLKDEHRTRLRLMATAWQASNEGQKIRDRGGEPKKGRK